VSGEYILTPPPPQGYFTGKKLKKLRLRRQNIFPCGEVNSHIFLRGRGEEFNF